MLRYHVVEVVYEVQAVPQDGFFNLGVAGEADGGYGVGVDLLQGEGDIEAGLRAPGYCKLREGDGFWCRGGEGR